MNLILLNFSTKKFSSRGCWCTAALSESLSGMYSVQAIYCIEYMFGILNHFVKSISFVDSFVDEFFTMFVCSWISCSVAKHHDGTDRKWVSLLCTATGTPHAEQFLSTAHRDLTGTTHNISEIGFTFSFCVSLCFFVGLLIVVLLVRFILICSFSFWDHVSICWMLS